MQIVIPAYNEAARLPRTLELLRRRARDIEQVVGRLEVVVVDNNSSDDTAELARRASTPGLPVQVVHCPIPGKGAAVRAGLLATTHELVAYMDADAATDLDAIVDGWRIMALGADIAVGSRAVGGAETTVRHTWLRGQGASLFRFFSSRVVPGVRDTQCGFKMMRGNLARHVAADLESDGFSFDVEFLARAVRRGATLAEFGVRWTDVPGSTFSPARHGASAFVELASIAWRCRKVAPVVAPERETVGPFGSLSDIPA